jgi:hypothetical protein
MKNMDCFAMLARTIKSAATAPLDNGLGENLKAQVCIAASSISLWKPTNGE